MSETVFLKNKELLEVTPVENIFIAQFMPLAPELAVKAYLYGLMLLSGAGNASEDIAKALGCSDTDVLAAFSYWEAAGIVKIIAGEPLQVQYLNIKNALIGSGANTRGAVHGGYVKKLQAVFGTRVISGAELSKLYDWIEVFGFEEDASVLIAKHCLDIKGAKTPIAYMDTVARTLASKNCLSFDAVSEHFESERKISGGVSAILKRWHQRRPPTEDEIALYEKWTAGWGFDDESIDIALSKMVTAQKPSFGYLDSILEEWHREGNIDREAIEKLQKREDEIYELARRSFKLAGLRSKPSAEQRMQFSEWCDKKKIDPDMILLAAELSQNDVRPYACMKRLIGEWYQKGIGSADEARKYYESGAFRKKDTKNGRALNYMQGRKYTRDDLKKLGISLGEEIYDNDER